MNPLFLMLEDGAVFEGESPGGATECGGLLSFHTGATGCQSVITDPANLGRIVLFTDLSAADCGVDPRGDESLGPKAAGAIVGSCSAYRQGAGESESLVEYLVEDGEAVLGCGFDTPAIMTHLITNGEMKAILSSRRMDHKEISVRAAAIDGPDYEPENRPLPCRRAKVGAAVMDLGASRSFYKDLVGLEVVDGLNPNDADLVIVSDAPYYLVEDSSVISQVSGWLGRKPLLGIGHGAAIVARACGAHVSWLPVGHHGYDIPVREVNGGAQQMTTQNHNYTIRPRGGLVSLFENADDGNCEGFSYSIARAAGANFFPDRAWFGVLLASIGLDYETARWRRR